MRFILGIALIYGFAAQFATSGSHVGLSNTRKRIIFIGRALSCAAVLRTHAAMQQYYATITDLLCKEYFNCKIKLKKRSEHVATTINRTGS